MKLHTTYYFSGFSELAHTATSIKSWFILFPLIILHMPDSTSSDNYIYIYIKKKKKRRKKERKEEKNIILKQLEVKKTESFNTGR
jgi:hypothetical protein